MDTFTSPTYRQSGTSWEIEHDRLLDHISYLEDCRVRTTEYLNAALRLSEDGGIGLFEVSEAMLLLWEAKDDSERRRFPEHVLGSEEQEEKEEQHG